MPISNLFAGRRGRVLSKATGPVIQPLEARRLLTTVYVDSTATGVASGSDWNDAFPTLQAALAAVNSGDQIHVAQGTYTPGANRTDTFQLVNGVTIQGGYEGLAANSMFGSPDDRDVNAFQTILSGEIGDPNTNADNSYHVVTSNSADLATVLDGFTISGGNADGTGDENSAQGAGMLNILGSPTVTNCTFTNNSASNYGGGMFDQNASPVLTSCTFTMNSSDQGGAMANVTSDSNNECQPQLDQCTFTTNTAGDSGGAIYDFESAPVLQNCTFTQNAAQNAFGGAIDDFISQSSINGCSFAQNSSGSNGGAIFDSASEAAISSSTFTGNTSGGSGGALSADSFVNIGQCTFTRNTAASSGGAITTSGLGNLYNCLFAGNTAGNGGAVSNTFANNLKFIDCAFVGNSATAGSSGDGGAVYNTQANDVEFINCTVTANQASAFGAGIYDSNSAIVVTNGIFWQNSSNFNPFFGNVYDSDSNSSSTVTFSDASGVSGPNDNNNSNFDPEFVSAPSAGIDNTWGTADDDYGNLELQFTSPAIDVGDTSAINQVNVFQDLANNNRVVSNIVDLGAYEAQVVYVDLNAAGNSTGADWADAFTDLNVALSNAPSGVLIKVAKGTYTGSFQLQSPFGSPRAGITLQGGYAGVQASDPNARDITNNLTTLSGGGVATHVVDVSDTDSSTVIDGFTITGGNANGPQDGRNNVGGGIYNLGGSPMISNCIITNNSAQYYGGMYNSGFDTSTPCAPTLIDCTFSNNTGGAMGDNDDSPTLIGCTFTNNTVGSSGAGGAINCSSQQVTLTDCTFTGNSAGGDAAGGAINCNSGELFMTDCSFISNTAADGGAIVFTGSDISAVNCLFANNTATGATFFGQTFGGNGGAINISNFPSSVTITNCTFSGNAAQLTGSLGGAVYEIGATPVITNSIFWNDSAATGNEIYDDPHRTDGSTVSHSDVGGGFAGTGNINADPKFVDPTHGDFTLQSTSPAIDAGDDTAIAGTSTDLAGNPRVSGAHVDMGAYESQVVAFSVVSTSFEFAARVALHFTVNKDVASFDSSKISVNFVNADGSLGASSGYSPSLSTRVFTINVPANLPDGNYRATLGAGALTDTSGNPSLATTYDFFILAGDANHDRIVNALDFNALATNYGQPGDSTQGNFNYFGNIDSSDFDILASRFGKTLSPPAGMAMPAVHLFSDSKIKDDLASDVIA